MFTDSIPVRSGWGDCERFKEIFPQFPCGRGLILVIFPLKVLPEGFSPIARSIKPAYAYKNSSLYEFFFSSGNLIEYIKTK